MRLSEVTDVLEGLSLLAHILTLDVQQQQQQWEWQEMLDKGGCRGSANRGQESVINSQGSMDNGGDPGLLLWEQDGSSSSPAFTPAGTGAEKAAAAETSTRGATTGAAAEAAKQGATTEAGVVATEAT
eukprot:752704-Pelagomonas_calceolata.AAC.2